jgi:hypothetical protein
MTSMSDSRCQLAVPGARNRASSFTSRVLARALHVLPALVLVGCILPPSLSVDKQDAGIDSPPAITSVTSSTQQLLEPGPVEFVVGPVSDQTMDLTLIDTDVGDTLYISVFVNYFVANPTPARASCTATPTATGSPIRTTTCDLTEICTEAEENNNNVWMEVVVFDRPVLDTGASPLYKATNGGLSTDRTYNLICLGKQST